MGRTCKQRSNKMKVGEKTHTQYHSIEKLSEYMEKVARYLDNDEKRILINKEPIYKINELDLKIPLKVLKKELNSNGKIRTDSYGSNFHKEEHKCVSSYKEEGIEKIIMLENYDKSEILLALSSDVEGKHWSGEPFRDEEGYFVGKLEPYSCDDEIKLNLKNINFNEIDKYIALQKNKIQDEKHVEFKKDFSCSMRLCNSRHLSDRNFLFNNLLNEHYGQESYAVYDMLRLCKKYGGKFNVDVTEKPVEFRYEGESGFMLWNVLFETRLPDKKFNVDVKDNLDDEKIIQHWPLTNK